MLRSLLLAGVVTVAMTVSAFRQEAKYSIAKQTIGELVKNEARSERPLSLSL